MTKSKILFAFCCAFILGIGFHAFIASERLIAQPLLWYSLFIGCGVSAALLFIVWSSRKGVIWILGLGMFFLGVFRFAQIIPNQNDGHLVQSVEREVTLRGIVATLPRAREKTAIYVIEILGQSGKLLLTAEPFPAYAYGDVLSITCTPTRLSEYELYMQREGVSAACAFPEHLVKIGHSPSSLIKERLFKIRQAFHTRLTALIPEPYGGLLAGILYGDTSGISQNLKQNFRITGLSHLTALSGYNISIISVTLVGMIVGLGLTRRQALPVTMFLILAFVISTGAESSVVRAAVMGLLAMLAKNVGRISDPRGALALAGAVMLTVNPRLLRFDLGFILSFIATAALVYFSEDIATRTPLRKFPKLWNIREAAASSVSALIFTTPVLLYATGIIGPFALLTNILVVPVVPAAMTLGFISAALDFLWHPLGIGLSFLARVPLSYMIFIAERFGRFGAFEIKLSFFGALIIFSVVALGMWRWKKGKKHAVAVIRLPKHPAIFFKLKKKIKALHKLYKSFVPTHWRASARWIFGIAAVAVFLSLQSVKPAAPLTVYFYNVGQGDAIHIRTSKGFDVLIDGGPTTRVGEKLGRTLPFWDRTIELMVLTHPHADHAVGLVSVLKRFKVEKVLATGALHTTDEYIEWLKEIKKQGVAMQIAKDGQKIVLATPGVPDAPELLILWPRASYEGKRVIEHAVGEGGGLNDTSIVAKLTYKQTSFLLMGDATSAVEQELLNDGLQADVLKVGHHGSKYSTSREFFDAVRPKYAVIQVGENRYGHPAYATLWRLNRAGVEVLRNDQDGDVVLESDGASVRRK